jgi:undecaprenyl-diphosphatase
VISLLSYDYEALTLLALIQGLTEFLPVSSSGHLVLAQAALGVDEPALALDVALHVGTLLAVLVVYRAAVLRLVRDVLRGQFGEARLLVIGTLPAGVIGVLFKDQIQAAFHRPDLAAIGLFVTALVLVAGEWIGRRRAADPKDSEDAAAEADDRLDEVIGWKGALLVGVFQACAIVPGISRSGSTIVAGMFCGLTPRKAARFSFLLSIPAIAGAAILSLPDVSREGFASGPMPVVWATFLAGFVGWGALRVLIAFLGRGVFAWFAVYCTALALGALAFG